MPVRSNLAHGFGGGDGGGKIVGKPLGTWNVGKPLGTGKPLGNVDGKGGNGAIVAGVAGEAGALPDGLGATLPDGRG